MAMESFRYSFMSENQDVNFDAILGELCELETQLGSAQSDYRYNNYNNGQCANQSMLKEENRDSGNDLAQAELDALATEITCSLGLKNKRPMADLDYFRTHYPGDLGGYSDLDIAETDSAFSESASLPSSESFTSMVTVSSSAEAAGMGDAGSIGSGTTITPQSLQCDEEQKARLKAEKIRIALEKIKEAKIKKLFVRAFASDGSSKSIMVDEKMTILEVIAILADKNHVNLNHDLAVIEHMPELFMERVLEDHDYLVENMAMWTRDTKNQILFESRPQKNALFRCPEQYLLVSSSSEKGASLDPKRRENLIQEFFSGSASQVPEVEGVLYLKSDGKKAWKKYFFVLRASGLYYNPKGKISKLPKDLTCLVQFEFVDLYTGFHWKKKHHSPTDFCFALKHPQIQKKTSKFIRYLCAENKAALDQWIMGIRIAKFGKQLLMNFQNLQQEILTWDSRDVRNSITEQSDAAEALSEALAELNQQGELSDSRLSMPTPGSRHSIVNVQNSMLVRESSPGSKADDILCLEIDKVESKTPERKSSLPGITPPISDTCKVDKVPVKRVSFSNTHSVIHDNGEEVLPVRHRDSITSASTDSSEDSNSSGEGRLGGMSHRNSKLRAKLPVTTGTTKQISEMVQTSLDGSTGSMDGSVEDWKPQGPVCSQVQKELAERRKSAPVCGDVYNCERRMEGSGRDQRSMSHCDPMSPSSPLPNQQFQYKAGSKGIMSPPMQKGGRSHSRGSSISSMDSADSYQGYLVSPTLEIPNPDLHGQPSWIQYDDGAGNFPLTKGHMVKQGPPTAQKPGSIKKTRPQSGPATGPLEKGHKRNTSKSSLESVEEIHEGHAYPGHMTGEGQGHRGVVMSPLPPRSVSAVPAGHPHMGPGHNRSMSQPSTPSIQNTSAPLSYPCPSAQTMGPHSTPATPAVPLSPVPGCMSPLLSSHRVVGPKPIAPPSAPCTPPTPPTLVPPTPRNPATAVKTHKKRPSGGNIVVNGNDAASLRQSGVCPDIVASPRLQEGQGAVEDDTNYAPLPFMAELNKHMVGGKTLQHVPQPPVSQQMPQPASQPVSYAEAEGVHIYDTLPACYDTVPPLSSHSETSPKLPPVPLPKPTDQRLNGNSSYHCNDSYHSNNVAVSDSNKFVNNITVASDKLHGVTSVESANINNRTSVLSPQQQQQQQSKSRQLPPPPPKRSETTKLTSSSPCNNSQTNTYPVDNNSYPVDSNSYPMENNTYPVENNVVPNIEEHIDPIYDNCDGILDISDLPPPPPELLQDFQGQGHASQLQGQGEGQRSGKVKPPPPPPKRSRETQLSMS